MTVYTVHMPRAIDLPAAAERVRFVREGFSFAAFLLGPLWLLYHRLWLATLVWVIAAVLIALATASPYLPAFAGIAVAFVAEIFVGLEANNLRRNRLPKRGFRLVDIAAGRNRDEAEQRFFDRWNLADTGADRSIQPSSPRRRGDDEIVGLFPDSGG